MIQKCLTIALALAMGLSAHASALTIGFSHAGEASDWQSAYTENISDAVEGAGWELVYADSKQSQEDQIAALRSLIAQEVDYILLSGAEGSGWEDVLSEINESGIPLLLLNSVPDCIDQIETAAIFQNDYEEEGARQIRWTAEYLKALGRDGETLNVALLEDAADNDPQFTRTAGSFKALEEYSNLNLIVQQSENISRADGQSAMEDWLESGMQIDIVIAQNDEAALGAVDALKAQGKVPGQDVIIIGCGASKAAFEAIIAGELNASVECTPLYGVNVIDTITRLESGEEIDQTIHPEENVYDCIGGIAYAADGETASIKAADALASRQY